MNALRVAVALLVGIAGAHAQDLIASNVATRAQTIVYELPGAAPEMVGMLTLMMKQTFPKAELVNASVASEDELRGKLRKTFILVTLLDAKSRLLPLVAQPLPLRLEDGTLRWGEFAAPANKLRVDFVGRNPYGAGYAVVSAVSSLGLLQGGESGGRYSYLIKNADGVLLKGTYDDEFTSTRHDQLKLADARADLNEFFTNLERIHPDPFARVAEQDYRRMKQQTPAELDTHADKDGQVPMEALAYILRYASAFIRDAHTQSYWGPDPYLEPMDNRRFPPFRFEFESGHFYITGATDASLTGIELVAVNGAPPAEFLKPVLDRISGETLTWTASRLAGSQDFWMWFSNIAGKAGSCCKLTLRDASGAESQRTLEAVTIAQYGKIRATSGRKVPKRNGTEVRMFDSGKIAHFIYPAFTYRPSEMQKIGDIFRQISEAGTRDVIVDLRGNGGGEPMMGSLIFSHLSPKPAPQFSAGRIKISPEAIQNMTSGLPLANEGELLTVSDPAALGKVFADAFAQAIQVPKQSNPFTGRVWLMVDHGTFSAANIFSEAFREQGIGKILGYETGEPTKIGGGITITFTLKRSGIPYRISASENFAGKLDLSVPEHGVMPDIPFDRKLLARFSEEVDPELAYTLEYVRTHR